MGGALFLTNSTMKFIQKLCLLCLCIIIKDNTYALAKTRNKKVSTKQTSHKGKIIKEKVSEAQPFVQISNGATIIGAVNKTVDQQKIYYSFRRIPYAVPPLGDLRFRPPVPLPSNFSQQIINATEDGPPCLQTPLLPIPVIGSEDCLYINVYTPQAPHQNAPLLPVMVWIYGGGFVNGDATYTSYGPDYPLDDNVMVVTFNYRVGIFGFLSTEDDAAQGNYGLKDQLLALKWVNKNIKYFGGNPEQVTVFGESAGAASVSYLTQTPLTKGLFQRAISESGTSLVLWALTRNPKAIAITTAAVLGVNFTSSQSLVDGLRNIDSQKLQAVESIIYDERILVSNYLNSLPFGPTVEYKHPDAIVVNKSYEQLENGLFQRVPYIMGFNSLEAVVLVQALNYIRWYLLRYDLLPTTLVPKSMNVDMFSTAVKVNQEIKSYYFGIIPVTLSQLQLIQYVSDDEFVRPILESALLYSQYAPVYLYKFSYQGALGSTRKSYPGVGHGEELPYLWRISTNKANATPSDILTRQRMVKLWTNFAKTGNPTPTNDVLLQNVKWPITNSSGAGNVTFLDIGNNLTVSINPNWEHFTFWNNLFNKYGNPPYSTY